HPVAGRDRCRQRDVRDRLPPCRLHVAPHQGGRREDGARPRRRDDLQDHPRERHPYALARPPRMSTLPSYDELPVKDGAPVGSSWGLWGDDDVFGCLNLLTQERVVAGLACATEGKVFNLNLDAELPSPPLFGRSAFEHNVLDLPYGHDDELSGWNTQ